MTRDFSIAYRATNLVDILMRKQAGVIGYRLLAAPQFDGTYVQLLEAPPGRSYLDPTIDRRRLHSMPGVKHVRAVFDPDSFGTGHVIDAGLDDTQQFWMRFQPVTSGGDGDESDPILVLTPSQHNGSEIISISGEAPVGADVSASMHLGLPRSVGGLTIQNMDGANPLYVAFVEGGTEIEITAGTTRTFYEEGVISDLYVRSTGGAVAFTADFSVPDFAGGYLFESGGGGGGGGGGDVPTLAQVLAEGNNAGGLSITGVGTLSGVNVTASNAVNAAVGNITTVNATDVVATDDVSAADLIASATISGPVGNITTVNATDVVASDDVSAADLIASATISGPVGNITTVNATDVIASDDVSAADLIASATVSGPVGNITTVNSTTVNAADVIASDDVSAADLIASATISGPVGNITTVNSTTVNSTTVNATGTVNGLNLSAGSAGIGHYFLFGASSTPATGTVTSGGGTLQETVALDEGYGYNLTVAISGRQVTTNYILTYVGRATAYRQTGGSAVLVTDSSSQVQKILVNATTGATQDSSLITVTLGVSSNNFTVTLTNNGATNLAINESGIVVGYHRFELDP